MMCTEYYAEASCAAGRANFITGQPPFARGCLRSARAENTIVIFPTDNGAEVFTWPDGGMTPFRATKEIGCQRSPPRQGEHHLSGYCKA
jgi:arylsulfatase A-like enzyme